MVVDHAANDREQATKMTALPARSARKAENAYVMPQRTQLAALCWRAMTGGGREVLLVTSSTGRWILPKGWPMRGKTQGEAAAIEAWEEAGVEKAQIAKKPLGQFISAKLASPGEEVPCTTRVFALRVDRLAEDWPEKGRRDRRWMPVAEAAEIVSEDGLRDILRRF